MNSAHLHLMLVHIPVVLVPTGAILLIVALWLGSKATQQIALSIFLVASIFAGISFSFGEGAEELVENAVGAVVSAIDAHEDSADIALWTTVALGITSLLGLLGHVFQQTLARVVVVPVLVLSLASSATLAYTAQEGGRIRHPEASQPSSTGTSEQGDLNDHDDD